jgi:hypothetical protein
MLAAPDDVSARLGRAFADEELPRVTALIEDAAALVSDYCTAGWETANPPVILKTVVCAEVIRWLSVTPGVVLERTGELETQYGQAASAQGLSAEAKAALSKYRRKVAVVSLRRD